MSTKLNSVELIWEDSLKPKSLASQSVFAIYIIEFMTCQDLAAISGCGDEQFEQTPRVIPNF